MTGAGLASATATSATATRAGATSAGPTLRSVTRSGRGPVLAVAGLVLVIAVLALISGTSPSGPLDPRSYDPQGTHALATLLERGGTPVQVVADGTQALSASGPRSVLVLPFPEQLPTAELALVSRVPGGLLVLGAEQDAVDALGLSAVVDPPSGAQVRRPACDLPVAVRAGAVRVGGARYSGAGTGCYASRGSAGLLALDRGRVLLGSADPLTNDRLGQEGNAALALGLLGSADRVLWLLPSAAAAPVGGRQGLLQLLPDRVVAAGLQLGLAVVVLALWRARRLGRVVVEPLPVVVRAAEVVEGRGRLYRAARARDAAADALRQASADAAVRRLGLRGPEGLVEAASARTGRTPAGLQDLLYGPVPVDDAALQRLADDLTRFDTEVAGS